MLLVVSKRLFSTHVPALFGCNVRCNLKKVRYDNKNFDLFIGPVDVTQIAANFVSSKADVIIRMRGLPFNSKESEVVSCLHPLH